MIGFEAELQVPAFRKANWPAGADAIYTFNFTSDIYSFLFCGYENTKNPVSVTKGLFKIKPDVAGYAELGKLLFDELSDFLQIDKAVRFGGEPRMTKLEYETYPLNEADVTSDKIYLAQAASIKDHASKFASEAQKKVVEVPDTRVKTGDIGTANPEDRPIGLEPAGMYAGVPVEDIEASIDIGKTDNKSQADKYVPKIEELLQRIQAEVGPKFALQATAGIFPSVIPQLFENRQRPLDQPFTPELREAWETAYPLICTSVQTIMDEAQFKNDAWVKTNLSGDVKLQAFKGHLYLLCSYLIGETLSQTRLFKKMSVKNAVPYHAKLNLGYFYKALPGGGSKTPATELAQSIAGKLIGQDCVKPEFWSKKGLPPEIGQASDRQERLIYGDPSGFVFNALTGKAVRTFINQRGTEKIEGEHNEPDSKPLNRHGERGVQLEFRRLGLEDVQPEGLHAAFVKVINEVRKLNGAYAS